MKDRRKRAAPAAPRSNDPRLRHRLHRHLSEAMRPPHDGHAPHESAPPENVVMDCGWGRLIFAHTFPDHGHLVETIQHERPGRRDIAFYLTDPHVIISLAPQDLFLDPSHTFRLWMTNYRPPRNLARGFTIRRLQKSSDSDAINTIYAARRMVSVDPEFLWRHRMAKHLTYFVAEDEATGEVIGTVMGIDHVHAFADPENGSSLWCLAVHPQASVPGVGRALVMHLAGHYHTRGRAFMDLSVMHDNEAAIHLYEKLGFQRVPVFAVKNKNAFNETLFTGPPVQAELNPYALIIVNEARRRGISVDVLDEEGGFFRLTHGGRTIVCRESLSQLTDAVAMSRCDDKAVTRRLLESHGLNVPDQRTAGDEAADAAFLSAHGAVVVKPARGEQGRGITVDVRTPEHLAEAIAAARQYCDTVLLEQCVAGDDLRIIVIDFRVVAAAVRRPAEVVGTGRHTVEQLIEAQSRRRAAATGGESRIPQDAETERVIRAAGHAMDDVLEEGAALTVRRTANLHTGGTIHDVTDRLHPRLVDAAVQAARAIDIPVVGLDFIVPRIDGPEYVIIEANERPGLANHEPQPTAERFIDLLFPQTTTS